MQDAPDVKHVGLLIMEHAEHLWAACARIREQVPLYMFVMGSRGFQVLRTAGCLWIL